MVILYHYHPIIQCKFKNKRKNKEDIVSDSLFWPIMSHPSDCVESEYSVPQPQMDEYQRHDQCLTSLWSHYVQVCRRVQTEQSLSSLSGFAHAKAKRELADFGASAEDTLNNFTKRPRLTSFHSLAGGKSLSPDFQQVKTLLSPIPIHSSSATNTASALLDVPTLDIKLNSSLSASCAPFNPSPAKAATATFKDLSIHIAGSFSEVHSPQLVVGGSRALIVPTPKDSSTGQGSDSEDHQFYSSNKLSGHSLLKSPKSVYEAWDYLSPESSPRQDMSPTQTFPNLRYSMGNANLSSERETSPSKPMVLGDISLSVASTVNSRLKSFEKHSTTSALGTAVAAVSGHASPLGLSLPRGELSATSKVFQSTTSTSEYFASNRRHTSAYSNVFCTPNLPSQLSVDMLTDDEPASPSSFAAATAVDLGFMNSAEEEEEEITSIYESSKLLLSAPQGKDFTTTTLTKAQSYAGHTQHFAASNDRENNCDASDCLGSETSFGYFPEAGPAIRRGLTRSPTIVSALNMLSLESPLKEGFQI